ncbi:TPA: hypothetical protein ACKRK7_005996, partial [Pseudomonas aeruginosa]
QPLNPIYRPQPNGASVPLAALAS